MKIATTVMRAKRKRKESKRKRARNRRERTERIRDQTRRMMTRSPNQMRKTAERVHLSQAATEVMKTIQMKTAAMRMEVMMTVKAQ